MIRWEIKGTRLYATRDGLEVSAEVPVRGQYTNARAWLRLLRLEIIFLTNRIEINRLQAHADEMYDLIKCAQVSSGVCMCGDNMEDHNEASGHAPVDIWDHAVEQINKD